VARCGCRGDALARGSGFSVDWRACPVLGQVVETLAGPGPPLVVGHALFPVLRPHAPSPAISSSQLRFPLSAWTSVCRAIKVSRGRQRPFAVRTTREPWRPGAPACRRTLIRRGRVDRAPDAIGELASRRLKVPHIGRVLLQQHAVHLRPAVDEQPAKGVVDQGRGAATDRACTSSPTLVRSVNTGASSTCRIGRTGQFPPGNPRICVSEAPVPPPICGALRFAMSSIDADPPGGLIMTPSGHWPRPGPRHTTVRSLHTV